MDVLKPASPVLLRHMKCEHDISIPTKYRPIHVVVFTDQQGRCYAWTTSTYPGFEPGKTYDIQAKLETETMKLSHVANLAELEDIKSEQPEATPKSPVDVFDLIFDTTK